MSVPWIIAFACLCVVVLALVVVVAAVLRRVALVLESQPPTTVAPQSSGPARGRQLPDLDVISADGESITLSSMEGPFVLAILTSHCAPCVAVADWLTDHPDQMAGLGQLVVLTDADGQALFDLGDRVRVLAAGYEAMMAALAIPGTPFAITVDADGRVADGSLLTGGAQRLLELLKQSTSRNGDGKLVPVLRS